MALDAATAERRSWRSRWPRDTLFALAAIGSSLVAAAWITDSNLPSLASAALPGNADRATFEDRFLAPVLAKGDALRVRRPAVATAEPEVPSARELLALNWAPQDFRAGIADDEFQTTPAKSGPIGIPLPRSRPTAADQLAQSNVALALAAEPPNRPAERSLLQKLSDRLTLASLNTGVNLFGKGPDLSVFGYDGATAVYDITAHAVYLPNGVVFEAHSGMGGLRDDPDHVSVHNQGATPPAVYSLKPREKEFHGVAALRMTPADGSDIGGRSGLLVHSFMLGPNGDSNGCISVKDYDRFLKAFSDGQFNRIAVVTSLKAVAQTLAAQNPT